MCAATPNRLDRLCSLTHSQAPAPFYTSDSLNGAAWNEAGKGASHNAACCRLSPIEDAVGLPGDPVVLRFPFFNPSTIVVH